MEIAYHHEDAFEKTRIRSSLEETTLRTDTDYLPQEDHHLRYGITFSKKGYLPEEFIPK